MSIALAVDQPRGFLHTINTRFHSAPLNRFLVLVLVHCAEHLSQAYQIWVRGWSRPMARGVLGVWYPWLITSEWLHYGYALVMLVALFALLRGFVGRAKAWWTVALAIQFWHH